MTGTSRRQLLKQTSMLVAATAFGGGRSTAEEAAAGGRRPNILFFLPDQHRWDWTPAQRAAPVRMPNLALLAARGVTFDRAYCAAPVCAPSRACLATGREYDGTPVRSNRDNYPLDRPSFYGRLRDSGYHTLGCGKIDLANGEYTSGRGLGTDGHRFGREWGFSDVLHNAGKLAGAFIYRSDPVGPKDSYYAYLDSLSPAQGMVCAEDFKRREKPKEAQWSDTLPSPLAEEHYLDNWIARNGLAQLDQAPRDRPWFQVVNFAGPHSPVDIPVRYERLYRGPERVIEDFPPPHRYQGELDAARHLAIRQNYAAMLENIDHWLGVYLDRLAERGELDSTLIVYSSDHGEMLGDHTHWGKELPYESSAAVPLVAAGPGVGAGRRSRALVSLIDLAATFLDFGDVEIPADMEGFSLRRLLEGKTDEHRQYVLSGLYDWRMVFDGRYKLVTNFEGAERRLYDLIEDPWEDVDVAAKDPGRVQKLSELMSRGSFRPT